MINNFYKTKLVYNVLDHINSEREKLKSDLVAYSNDPVRYSRRFRMLTNLAEYEITILKKIREFDSIEGNDSSNGFLMMIKQEIKCIVDTDA